MTPVTVVTLTDWIIGAALYWLIRLGVPIAIIIWAFTFTAPWWIYLLAVIVLARWCWRVYWRVRFAAEFIREARR